MPLIFAIRCGGMESSQRARIRAAVIESCPQPAHKVDMAPSYWRTVSPTSFVCEPGGAAIGLEIDGIRSSSFGSAQDVRHGPEAARGFPVGSSDGRQEALHDFTGAQRKTAIEEQRLELLLGDGCLQRDQGLELVVAVLLHDVIHV